MDERVTALARRYAEASALGEYLSEGEQYGLEAVTEALEQESGELMDELEIVIWSPFADDDPAHVAELIVEHADYQERRLLEFAGELLALVGAAEPVGAEHG